MVAIEFVEFQPGDEIAVHQLVINVFDRFVAPDFSPEGCQTFINYVEPERIGERVAAGTDHIFLAQEGEKLVGALSIRNMDHISLLFVDPAFHGRVIARGLYQYALNILKPASNGIDKMTVHSSPYAVKIYEKLGFVSLGEMREENGIKFVPMEADLP